MKMNNRRICLWLVPTFGALLLLAFFIAPGFVPPSSPMLSAQEVADYYRNNVGAIRTSTLIFNLCGVMFIPFYMVKCRIVIRSYMEVRFAPAWLRLACDAWLMLTFGMLSALYWSRLGS